MPPLANIGPRPFVGGGGANLPGGAGRGHYMPQIGFVITMPDWLASTARLKRIHNRASKEAARQAMMMHWRQRIPGHFRQDARRKYDHHPRAESTKRIKRELYRSAIDLIQSGKTKGKMTRELPRIQVGGSASGIMRAKMFLGFPFPATFDSTKPQAVGPEKMAKEISRWTDAEMAEASRQYRDAYVKFFEMETANSPKVRKSIGGALTALRNA